MAFTSDHHHDFELGTLYRLLLCSGYICNLVQEQEEWATYTTSQKDWCLGPNENRWLLPSILVRPENSYFWSILSSTSNAGGGGERVLWAAIVHIQKTRPDVLCVVYSGDKEASKEEIIAKVKVSSRYPRMNLAYSVALSSRVSTLFSTRVSFISYFSTRGTW